MNVETRKSQYLIVSNQMSMLLERLPFEMRLRSANWWKINVFAFVADWKTTYCIHSGE
jgi:hypothetical protein